MSLRNIGVVVTTMMSRCGRDALCSFASSLHISLASFHELLSMDEPECPCWCPICGAIVTEHTCPHEDAWLQISGTDVRNMLARGECPPPEIMRPEIAQFLVDKAKEGKVFFEG